MFNLKTVSIIVLLDALVMAIGHAPLARLIFFSRPPGAGRGPPGPFGPGAIGGYFLIATIVYVLAGALVASGKLYKLANLGLIILAVVDNILLIYTRTMPNIFFGRIIPWSWEWYPVGTVQILIGQMIIIVLCAYLLQKGKATKQITKP